MKKFTVAVSIIRFLLCIVFTVVAPFQSVMGEEGGSHGGGGGDLDILFDRKKDEETLRKERQLVGIRSEARRQLEFLLKDRSESKSELYGDNTIKNQLLKVLKNPDFYKNLSPRNVELINKLVSAGLEEDIKNSKYVISESCVDSQNQEKTLTTQNGTFEQPLIGSPICFNVKKFYEQYLKLSDLPVEPEMAKYEHKDPVAPKVLVPVWFVMGLLLHDHARHFGVTDDENHVLAHALSKSIHKSTIMTTNEFGWPTNLTTLLEHVNNNNIHFINGKDEKYETLYIQGLANPELYGKLNFSISTSEDCVNLHGAPKVWSRLKPIKLGLTEQTGPLFNQAMLVCEKEQLIGENIKAKINGAKITIINVDNNSVIFETSVPLARKNLNYKKTGLTFILVNFDGTVEYFPLND